MTLPLIPSKGWATYDLALKAVGEGRPGDLRTDLPFLRAAGLVEQTEPPQLSDLGKQYFGARFVRHDDEAANAALRAGLLTLPTVAAVTQLLDGVPGATRDTVETVLRSEGYGDGLRDRDIGFMVTLLSRTGIIEYNKTSGAVEVLLHPAREETPPASVLISPATPFANRVWLRRVLEEGTGQLMWLDKHFSSAAFEAIWEAAQGQRISRIRILSLYMENDHSGRKVKRDLYNLVTDLAARQISFEWRVVDSRKVHDTHDRWIISDSSARNVPNVNAIVSGQHSELNTSSQRSELERLFEKYWAEATPIESVWNPTA